MNQIGLLKIGRHLCQQAVVGYTDIDGKSQLLKGHICRKTDSIAPAAEPLLFLLAVHRQ